MPGCRNVNRLRPASNLFNPFGSSVVLVVELAAASVAPSSASDDEASVDASAGAAASVVEASPIGLRRDIKGFARRT